MVFALEELEGAEKEKQHKQFQPAQNAMKMKTLCVYPLPSVVVSCAHQAQQSNTKLHSNDSNHHLVRISFDFIFLTLFNVFFPSRVRLFFFFFWFAVVAVAIEN